VSKLALLDELEIPDSVVPVKGYKALSVRGDTLTSPSYTMPWPQRQRLEAHCASGPAHWTWVPIEGEPRETDATIEIAELQARAVTLSSRTIASSAAGHIVMAQPPPKPSNPLPPGWSWSWEPLTHDAPAEGCNCGIHVASRPQDALSYLPTDGIIAEITLWGKVIRGTSGARGQYAYPTQLLVPTKIADEVRPVSEAYGAPLMILDPRSADIPPRSE